MLYNPFSILATTLGRMYVWLYIGPQLAAGSIAAYFNVVVLFMVIGPMYTVLVFVGSVSSVV
ncbi:hypothetical protein DSECCO2_547610 [anaerobic digester metagenome]